ncbi:hypothetical protein IE53DRAFT_390453 [Violaceomyces palustris]|uniref:Uncharacterized protein n=1 Tax=Violaceomyces palustris TaxID=1673888 RepID=A0ACD0NNQ2_9BASI|nr:hypothetical protein IE53DRAFT_390453 [Violaceomyces palustris]
MPAQALGRSGDRQRFGRSNNSSTATALSRLQSQLGLSPSISLLNLSSFLLHSASSILFLVFLNSIQPFVIHQIQLHRSSPPSPNRIPPVPEPSAGSLSGTLIFSDELLSTFLALFWGATADIYSSNLVATLSYLFIAFGLVAYTFPTSQPLPGLLIARLIFAVGGSGATAMLSAILAEYSDKRLEDDAAGFGEIKSASSVPSAQPSQSSLHSEINRVGGHGTEGHSKIIERAASETSLQAGRPDEENPSTEEAEGEGEDPETLLEGYGSTSISQPFPSGEVYERVKRSSAGSLGGDSGDPGRLASKRTRHGRLAALAGFFTGLGALISVFGLLRLPALIARSLETDEVDRGGREADGKDPDRELRIGTIASLWIVAGFAVLVSILLFFGLKGRERGVSEKNKRRRDTAWEGEDPGGSTSYGSGVGSDARRGGASREERRRRLRRMRDQRLRQSFAVRFRTVSQLYLQNSLLGFRLAGRVRTKRIDPTNDIDEETGAGASTARSDHQVTLLRTDLSRELRLAYLGGSLARAFTIATTAFLPLLISNYYYTSGACSSSPPKDLPLSELKKYCRKAFTATSILGGITQLCSLLLSPLVGYLSDRFNPGATLAVTSLVGSLGLLVISVGIVNQGGGTEEVQVPDPLTGKAFVAAMAVGLGQIGSIVTSLASCARSRNLLYRIERLDLLSSRDRGEGEEEEAHDIERVGREGEEREENEPLLLPDQGGRSQREGEGGLRGKRVRWTTEAAGKEVETIVVKDRAGAIAGSYSSIGSITILITSKLGGGLFDLYAPSPFLLVAGLGTSVSLYSAWVQVCRVLDRRRMAP